MRRAALLAAIILAAMLSTKPTVAVAADDPNRDTHNLMRDAFNPYAGTSQPPAEADHMHHRMHHHMHHQMHMHHMMHGHHMKHGKKM